MAPRLFLPEISVIVEQTAPRAAASSTSAVVDDAGAVAVRTSDVMAVMPGRAGLLAHDLDVLMPFLEFGAAEIRRSLHH
jgi:hypothetical protein